MRPRALQVPGRHGGWWSTEHTRVTLAERDQRPVPAQPSRDAEGRPSSLATLGPCIRGARLPRCAHGACAEGRPWPGGAIEMLHGVLLPTLHGLRAEDHRPRSYAGLSAELAGEGRQRGWRGQDPPGCTGSPEDAAPGLAGDTLPSAWSHIAAPRATAPGATAHPPLSGAAHLSTQIRFVIFTDTRLSHTQITAQCQDPLPPLLHPPCAPGNRFYFRRPGWCYDNIPRAARCSWHWTR